MEIDSGLTLSIISMDTFLQSVSQGNWPTFHFHFQLFPCHRVLMVSDGIFTVIFKDFRCSLWLVAIKGHHTSLLGQDWFELLGIYIMVVHQISQSNVKAVCSMFPATFVAPWASILDLWCPSTWALWFCRINLLHKGSLNLCLMPVRRPPLVQSKSTSVQMISAP